MKTQEPFLGTPPSVWVPAFRWLEKWDIETTQWWQGQRIRCKLCELFVPAGKEAREAHLKIHIEELWAVTGKTTEGADFFDVPDKELRQLIYDTLMKVHDAADDKYVHMKGLDRGREVRTLANEVISEMKTAHAKIGEHSFETPMCEGCIEELAA